VDAPATILFAGDHPVFRKGLVNVIAEDVRFEIVVEASDGATALDLIQKLNPSIALLDVDMPRLNGLVLAEKLKTLRPSVRVIVLTSYNEHWSLAILLDSFSRPGQG